MKLYNTMSMQKEEFVPIEPGKVRMYACGPTVYNYIHVGNARPIIMFDVLRRYLEYRGYEVTFVQNFTDVDDKIIKRANEEGISSEEVAKKYIAEYFTDAHALGVREATVHPKATENIQQIIDLITTLIDKGYAYEVNGDVYYRTLKFKDYGKLSHQPIEDLQSGARIDVNDIKENPLDFALWKAAKPGEPFWPSPWGNGRPGWHIECSAMSNRYLGKTIDIHCGGSDLAFQATVDDEGLNLVFHGVGQLEALAVEDLDAVVLRRVVRGRDDDAAVAVQLAHEQRDSGCRDDAGQKRCAAHRHDAGRHGRFQHVARKARVLADEDGLALERHGRLAELEGEVARELRVRHPANPVGPEKSCHVTSPFSRVLRGGGRRLAGAPRRSCGC